MMQEDFGMKTKAELREKEESRERFLGSDEARETNKFNQPENCVDKVRSENGVVQCRQPPSCLLSQVPVDIK